MVYHSGNELVDPYVLFQKAHLSPRMHIADFGCGKTGHIVFPAAVQIGDHGIVYAVDILKDVLELVQKRAKSDNLLNIHTVWADIERGDNIAIPKNSLDIAFLVNVLMHMHEREQVLQGVLQFLKPKGRCVIVDWAKKGLPFCPQDGQFVDFEAIARWARGQGIAVQETFPMGRYHRGLVLYKHE